MGRRNVNRERKKKNKQEEAREIERKTNEAVVHVLLRVQLHLSFC